MPSSNGGYALPLGLELIPVNEYGVLFFDTTNYNDPNNPSFYNWKIEDIMAGRMPTVNRVLISYRDLGLATIGITLNGMYNPVDNNNANVLKQVSTTASIGTSGASGNICTLVWGTNLSAFNMWLNISRAANAGPVSITKVRLEGKVEKEM